MISRYRVIAVALVLVLGLGAALSFSSVREAAAGFLSIFRVEKVQTVSLDLNDLQQIESALREGGRKVDLKQFGRLEVDGKVKMTPVTLAEAQKMVSFAVKEPQVVPPGLFPLQILYSSPATASFTLKVNNVNALLEHFGSKSLLPPELDGKKFSLDLPAAVVMQWAAPDGRPELTIVQSYSPQLKVPEGVDLENVRKALLGLPILPDDLKRQLTAIDDWQHTAVIPGINGSTRSVTVQGVPGAFITEPGSGGLSGENSLIWVKDGLFYAVQGKITCEQALQTANSLR